MPKVNSAPKDLGATLPSALKKYLDLFSRFSALPRVLLRQLTEIEICDHQWAPLFALDVPPSNPERCRAKVLLLAGVHGDEPAGVHALINFFESYAFALSDFQILAFPCVNPAGFLRSSRFGSTNHDLNRVVHEHSLAPEIRAVLRAIDERGLEFDAFFDLHEDNPLIECDFAPSEPDPEGVYLYESKSIAMTGIGKEIISELSAQRIPVCNWRQIYGESAERGVVITGPEGPRSSLLHFERFMSQGIAARGITVETPANWPLQARIHAHVTALAAGIFGLKK